MSPVLGREGAEREGKTHLQDDPSAVPGAELLLAVLAVQCKDCRAGVHCVPRAREIAGAAKEGRGGVW